MSRIRTIMLNAMAEAGKQMTKVQVCSDVAASLNAGASNPFWNIHKGNTVSHQDFINRCNAMYPNAFKQPEPLMLDAIREAGKQMTKLQACSAITASLHAGHGNPFWEIHRDDPNTYQNFINIYNTMDLSVFKPEPIQPSPAQNEILQALANAESEILTLRKNLSDTQSQLASSTEDKQTLQTKYDNDQAHSASLLQTKETELAQLNDKLQKERQAKLAAEERAALLNESLRTAQSNIDSLKAERDKANQVTQNLTKALALKDKELTNINAEKQSAASKITTLEADLKSTQQDKTNLEQKISILDTKLKAQPAALKEPIIFTPPFFITHAEVAVQQSAKAAQFARDTAFACFDHPAGSDSTAPLTSAQSNAQVGLPLSARESDPTSILRLSHEQHAHDYAQRVMELRATQAQTFPFFVVDCALALWENFANIKYVCNQMVPGCIQVVEYSSNFISNTTAVQYFKSTALSNSLVMHQTDIERAVWTGAHVTLIFKGASHLHMMMYGVSKILTNMDELLMPQDPTFLSCLPDAVITGGLPGIIGGLPFGPVSIGASSLLLISLQEINCLSGKNIKIEQNTGWWPVISDAAALTFVTMLAFLKPEAANHKFAFGMFALGFIVATDQFSRAAISLLSAQQHSIMKSHKICAGIDNTFMICQNNHDEQPYLIIPKAEEKPACMLQLSECCKVGTHKICPTDDGYSTITGRVNNEHIETCVVHC